MKMRLEGCLDVSFVTDLVIFNTRKLAVTKRVTGDTV